MAQAKKAETTSLAGFVEVADEREISKELEARAQRRRELGAAAVDDEEHDDLGINPIFLQAQQQLENGVRHASIARAARRDTSPL
jgi:hypothetical protein